MEHAISQIWEALNSIFCYAPIFSGRRKYKIPLLSVILIYSKKIPTFNRNWGKIPTRNSFKVYYIYHKGHWRRHFIDKAIWIFVISKSAELLIFIQPKNSRNLKLLWIIIKRQTSTILKYCQWNFLGPYWRGRPPPPHGEKETV